MDTIRLFTLKMTLHCSESHDIFLQIIIIHAVFLVMFRKVQGVDLFEDLFQFKEDLINGKRRIE